MQREFVTRLAILFGGGTRSGLHVIGQARQLGFVLDDQGVVVGCVEHVFREFRAQCRLRLLDLGVAFLFVFRQFGARQAEVADGVVHDALARGRKRGESDAVAQGFILVEQRQVLPQLGPEFGQLGLVVVVGRAQFRRVDHGVKMTDHAPGARQAFGGVFQRFDEAVPGGRRVWGLQLGYGSTVLRQQGIEGGRDVFRLDGVETGQAGKV